MWCIILPGFLATATCGAVDGVTSSDANVDVQSMTFGYGDGTAEAAPPAPPAVVASTVEPCSDGFKTCRRNVFTTGWSTVSGQEEMRKGAAALRCKFLSAAYTSDVVKMVIHEAGKKDKELRKTKYSMMPVPYRVRMNPKLYIPHLRPETCKTPATPVTCAYIAFLLLGEPASKGDWDALFGGAAVDFLARSGVLMKVPGTHADYKAVVQIFPVDFDLAIATDMTHVTFRDDYEDVMYIGADSEGLVHNGVMAPAAKVLDLCTGSGIQAIAALRYYADAAILVDVNPRAVRFARFNLLLNGLDARGEVREGNLYSALTDAEREEGFDAVLANPPFIPAPTLSAAESTFTVPNPNAGIDGLRPMPFYGDGGNDGERVMEAIVSGAGAVLKEGGRLSIVADIMDAFAYVAVPRFAGRRSQPRRLATPVALVDRPE